MNDNSPQAANDISATSSPRTIRRFQFTVRCAMVLIAALCVVFTWIGSKFQLAQRQRRVAESIQRLDGSVWYDFQLENIERDPQGTIVDMRDPIMIKSTAVPNGPPWFHRFVGIDFFNEVREIYVGELLPGSAKAELGAGTAQLLASCRGLEELSMGHMFLPEESVHAFRELTGLRQLELTGSEFPPQLIESIATLSQIESLDLSHSNIRPEDISTLTRLRLLRLLELSNTSVNDACIPSLLLLECLHSLKQM